MKLMNKVIKFCFFPQKFWKTIITICKRQKVILYIRPAMLRHMHTCKFPQSIHSEAAKLLPCICNKTAINQIFKKA